MNSINIFYRFNLLAAERIDLGILISSSTGVELALYRMLHNDVSEEMKSLIPQIQNIFKRIRNRRIAKDIMAIYFEDVSYQDWAETYGIPVETLYRDISDTLEAIDREIEAEAA